MVVTREQLEAMDAGDVLARVRDEFILPEGVIYLDGNSLGPLTRRAASRLEDVARRQWGGDLIRSWNVHAWIDLPARVGGRIARLVGAAPDEVIVADSTSVNLFKLLSAALDSCPGRRVIVADAESFPTDLYMADGLARLVGGGAEVRLAPRHELASALGPEVAALMLTQVDFRTGAMHDLTQWTDAAHAAGALMVWDLAHSAGAVPVDLGAAGADMAVGCGYKYLNGGPGAPAFAFVARRHHDRLTVALPGWMGHAAPFDLEPRYRPAAGVARLACGTPPILSLAALDAALEVFEGLDMAVIRAKSVALTGLFVALVEQECGWCGFELASPRDPARRGSQVSWRHPEGYAVVQALIDRGVIGDFRAPDILRFGLAPLYLRFTDVWSAVEALAEVMASRAWDRPAYRRRSAVT